MFTLKDISEIYSMIQRLNSFNLLTGKLTEKVPWAIHRPDKKVKKGSRWSFCQCKNQKYFQIWLLHRFPIKSEKCIIETDHCKPLKQQKKS